MPPQHDLSSAGVGGCVPTGSTTGCGRAGCPPATPPATRCARNPSALGLGHHHLGSAEGTGPGARAGAAGGPGAREPAERGDPGAGEAGPRGGCYAARPARGQLPQAIRQAGHDTHSRPSSPVVLRVEQVLEHIEALLHAPRRRWALELPMLGSQVQGIVAVLRLAHGPPSPGRWDCGESNRRGQSFLL